VKSLYAKNARLNVECQFLKESVLAIDQLSSVLVIFYFPHMKYGKYWFHLQKKNSRFRTFYTKKTSLEQIKNFRLSRGVAVGFWTKFEVQLAQPC
jgi:hypothetical protein